ncbi:MAG: hypothetical protein Q8Q05_01135 [bacterium]|nr:hypothetical protein [bacterium]
MTLTNVVALGVYAGFLLLILIINLLYVFQVFKYRLPGDASIPILVIHISLMVTILVFSSLYLGIS